MFCLKWYKSCNWSKWFRNGVIRCTDVGFGFSHYETQFTKECLDCGKVRSKRKKGRV